MNFKYQSKVLTLIVSTKGTNILRIIVGSWLTLYACSQYAYEHSHMCYQKIHHMQQIDNAAVNIA